MRFFLSLLFSLYASTLFAEVTIIKKITISGPVILPIEKPDRPIFVRPPVRPIVNTGIVYQDNYYNDNVGNSCQSIY